MTRELTTELSKQKEQFDENERKKIIYEAMTGSSLTNRKERKKWSGNWFYSKIAYDIWTTLNKEWISKISLGNRSSLNQMENERLSQQNLEWKPPWSRKGGMVGQKLHKDILNYQMWKITLDFNNNEIISNFPDINLQN